MKQYHVTERIADYIKNNRISITQVAFDTGIPKQKLCHAGRECLEAEEFLRLCQYLNVRPEEFK